MEMKQKSLVDSTSAKKALTLQASSEQSFALDSFVSTESSSSHLAEFVASLRHAVWIREQSDQKGTSHSHSTKEVFREANDSADVGSLILSVFVWVGVILLAILVLLILLLVTTPCWLGPAVKAAIENLDKKALGVDIVVDSVSVNTFSARVEIKGLKVCNPSGYDAAHMLEIDTLLLDLNFQVLMCSLLKSLFSSAPIQVIVSHFVFVKFQAMVEKHSLHTSNVKQILDHVSELTKKKENQDDPGKTEDDPGKTEAGTGAASESVGEAGDTDSANKKPKTKPKPQITIREIKIQDIDVRFQVEGQIFGKHLDSGCDITIADVDYEDFSKDHGSHIADDTALFILETLLKMIVTNIAGRKVGNHFF
jgi:hypothetical protein